MFFLSFRSVMNAGDGVYLTQWIHVMCYVFLEVLPLLRLLEIPFFRMLKHDIID